jgi:hypothetical protein
MGLIFSLLNPIWKNGVKQGNGRLQSSVSSPELINSSFTIQQVTIVEAVFSVSAVTSRSAG